MLSNEGEPRELFNLAQDPLELFNLIDQHPAQVKMLVTVFTTHSDSIASDPLRPNIDQGYEK